MRIRLEATHPIFDPCIGSKRLAFQMKYHPDSLSLDVETIALHRMMDLSLARAEAPVNPEMQACLDVLEEEFATNRWWRFAAVVAQFDSSVWPSPDDLSPPTTRQFQDTLPSFHWAPHAWTPVDRTVILATWCARDMQSLRVLPLRSLSSECPWAPQTIADGLVIEFGHEDRIELSLLTPLEVSDHTTDRGPLTMGQIHTAIQRLIQLHTDDSLLDLLCRLSSALTFYHTHFASSEP